MRILCGRHSQRMRCFNRLFWRNPCSNLFPVMRQCDISARHCMDFESDIESVRVDCLLCLLCVHIILQLVS